MFIITIQEWTNRKTGEHKPRRSFYAELVETLLANSPQPPELILKYYGEDAQTNVKFLQKLLAKFLSRR